MTSTTSHDFVKGSKLQIRRLINDNPQRIEEQLRKVIPGWGTAEFDWRSPLASEQYKEYCDEEFLAVLGLEDYSKRWRAVSGRAAVPIGMLWPEWLCPILPFS